MYHYAESREPKSTGLEDTEPPMSGFQPRKKPKLPPMIDIVIKSAVRNTTKRPTTALEGIVYLCSCTLAPFTTMTSPRTTSFLPRGAAPRSVTLKNASSSPRRL